MFTAKPVAGLVDAPTAAHVNERSISIIIISHLVPLTLWDVAGIFCAVMTRNVNRKVIVVDATAHCCDWVGPIVGGLNDRCVLITMMCRPTKEMSL